MGSIPGLPEMPVEDIKTIAKTTMTTFAPIYAKSFAIGLVNQLKKEVSECDCVWSVLLGCVCVDAAVSLRLCTKGVCLSVC